MSFYQEILKIIERESKKDNCPYTVFCNPKKEKALKGKTFEQVQKEAAKYGLYLTWNDNFNITYDTHTYVFSTSPLDKYGFPVEMNFQPS